MFGRGLVPQPCCPPTNWLGNSRCPHDLYGDWNLLERFLDRSALGGWFDGRRKKSLDGSPPVLQVGMNGKLANNQATENRRIEVTVASKLVIEIQITFWS